METFYRVILDTNFMLIPLQFGVDIKAELDRILDFNYRLCTLPGVLKELEVLSKEKSRDGRAAKGSLEMAKDFATIDANGDVDDTLLSLASNDTIICTNDKILREKIKRKGASVIYLRQKKYLMID
jgi:rRNA-processing protein FCF1